VLGQDHLVESMLIGLLANGNLLIESLPGLAKTRAVKTLAKHLAADLSRVQFTPDLLPSDVTGAEIYLQTDKGGQFQFQKGPIFANLVLADEINRATPKTQSALLEAMQEKSVTVAGKTFQLVRPFFVLATQNPLEMEGTYPLPEAQLDRFFFKLLVKFPSGAEIERILDRTTEGADPKASPVFDGHTILEMSALARQIPIADELRRYGINLVLATHPEHEMATEMTRKYVRYGSSPRGAQAIILAAKIRAILDHRYHVSRDDIRAVAPPALRHRLILNFEGQAENVLADDIILDALDTIDEPAAVAAN
jgi:MoxR-like ATPase